MRKAAIPLALLVVAALVFVLTRGGDAVRAPDPGPEETPDSEGQAPTELVYAIGKQVFVLDLGSGDETEAGLMPTTDFDISPDGTRWAVTDGIPDKRDPRPEATTTEIIVGDVGSDQGESIGPGYSPLWSPDGTEVAAVAPADGYLICPLDVDPEKAQEDPAAEGCEEGERVISYDFTGESKPVVALGGNFWRILGWTGVDRIIGVSGETGAVVIGDSTNTGEPPTVPLRARQIWAASPTETRLFVTTGATTAIADSDAEVQVPVDVQGVDEAAWAPDGATIAADSAGLVFIDADSGETTPVFEAVGSTNFVWSADSSMVAFQLRDEVIVCSVATQECTQHKVPRGSILQALR